MLKSLSVQCDPIDQPAATDPVESRTWCALRIRISGRTVSRIWDKQLGEERSLLYVPAMPVAEWIVSHWWTLLHEPCRTEEVPKPDTALAHLSWIQRHCLRSAESGLLLPALYLFNDGRGIHAEWQADEPGSLANMPGEFVDSGSDDLELAPTADALSRFVSEVLVRARSIAHERVEELSATWNAIRNADAEESRFCVVAGRMGIDPYDPTAMTDQLGAFIEDTLGDPETPLACDLTEVAEVDSIVRQWSWIQQTAQDLNLGPVPKPIPIRTPAADRKPSKYGYQLASQVRRRAGLHLTEPVDSVEAVIRPSAEVPFYFQEHNHLPDRGVRALVGWDGPHRMLFAGPRPPRPDNHRFLTARAAYYALFASQRGARLVTDAYTWDQQASRAFAADLLAPQAALADLTAGWADRGKIETFAEQFQVSTIVIRKQLENAGVTLIEEA